MEKETNLAKAFRLIGYKIESALWAKKQAEIKSRYPVCMSNCYCGYDYPASWDGPVFEALDVIEASGAYTVAQIKEKFGRLRIYVDSVSTDDERLWKYIAVEMAIKRAERKVYAIEKARGNRWLNEENDE